MMKRMILLSGILPVVILLLSSCTSYPTAGFFASEVVVEVGGEVYFTNNSCCACRFEWDFGDGTWSEVHNPVHSWEQGGIYTVILTAWSKHGNADRALMDITVIQPTTLEIQVKEINSETPLPGARVTLYPTLYDWQQETNAVVEATTDDNGYVAFIRLDPRKYYVDVWEKTHNNYGLAQEDVRFIETQELTPNEINTFTAWVEEVEAGKGR